MPQNVGAKLKNSSSDAYKQGREYELSRSTDPGIIKSEHGIMKRDKEA